MNWFDQRIIYFFNGFAHRSATLDQWVVFISGDGFQKGGFVILLLWWLWFLPGRETERNREYLGCVLLASPVALAISRFISFVAPFRTRPLHTAGMHIRLAYGLDANTLINWNSFPSDHAVLFFTLVAGLYFASRRIGRLAGLYILVIVCLPRIYLGIHYPTDIISGAVIGLAVGYLACLPMIRARIARPLVHWMEAYPAISSAALFFYTYQIADAFGWARDLVVLAYHSVVATGLHV
jgi:undecaprenyl-diphosphatase